MSARSQLAQPAHELIHTLRVVGRFVRRQGKTAGASPGTVIHTGERRVERVEFDRFEYGEGVADERRPRSLADALPFAEPPLVTWLNVDGLHDTTVLTELGQQAGIHPLVLEDISSIGQRPKADDYESQLYIVLRMLSYNEASEQVDEEQVSILLGSGYVISFQEEPGDVFDPVRQRIRSGKGRLRSRPADYLAYALIDAIVDEYFVVLEKVGDKLEELEAEVMSGPTRQTMNAIHRFKRELLVMRKAVWPLRDVLNGLLRDDCELISDNTRIFLRDAYDHVVQVIDTVETMRDIVSGLIDLYLSTTGNRMNEIMKVLTIIATIFIPLTFVAGVYGMNFDVMPELHWPWGYPAVLLLMAGVVVVMLMYFRRQKWL
jgi:magnesium transporter